LPSRENSRVVLTSSEAAKVPILITLNVAKIKQLVRLKKVDLAEK